MARVKSRRVSFKPFVEIHKIGNSGAESSSDSESGSSCVAYSIDDFGEGVKMSQTYLKGPGEILKKTPDLNESLEAHNGCSEPWAEKSKMLKKKLRRISSKEPADVKADKHHEEQGSDGSVFADTEMVATPEHARKKKRLTKNQRRIREVGMRLREMHREEMESRNEYRQKLQLFIDKAKRGKTTRSIVSNETEDYEEDKPFLTFSAERLLWASHKHVDQKKLNFQMKAAIRHRINSKNVSKEIRMAYSVILDNYDPILAPHFYALFRYQKKKHFAALETSFLLNQ